MNISVKDVIKFKEQFDNNERMLAFQCICLQVIAEQLFELNKNLSELKYLFRKTEK
jgi:hypothetical protein